MTRDRVWKDYTRGVTPVAAKAKAAKLAKAAPVDGAAKRRAAENAPPALPVMAAAPPLALTQSVERKREKALRNGELELDARLDLHGMTQTQAFAALLKFLSRCVARGDRAVLLITGKGRDGGGVLRANLPLWLAQAPQADRILALRKAAPCHGGDGAFYVLLRRKR